MRSAQAAGRELVLQAEPFTQEQDLLGGGPQILPFVSLFDLTGQRQILLSC